MNNYAYEAGAKIQKTSLCPITTPTTDNTNTTIIKPKKG